ncbi:hypothetical protein Aab01nite_18500 [Paractinoplanes abujensis]|uniref:Glycosyl transferase family 28 C-terminal domain-containing protein n=1 Tax=Paractinoplanes abujensis TaxID=882441 RepID=A0A7W7CZG8_9ACTN|nr:glycosyltransferase [Actinoplanes abujensis]MBB4697264.1 hypothetical protein [Actinoplanes abujensis]GID18260.1 hypothetical protein Aab01nite_18500 [Actinoplanes abujensis]
MTATVHDVAILADFRFAGAGVAAEVHAQHEAALSTLLVHVPRDARPLPFAPQVRDLLRDGAATLAREDRTATVRLLIARGADLLAEARTRVRAEHTVVVADRAPEPGGDLPDDVEWAPVDDRVREAMPLLCRLTVHNWHEVVDAAASWQEFPERFRALERTSGHQSHLRRLAGFGIRPRISAPALPREPGPVPPAPTRRVLLLGAPTRLTAIARRLPPALAPVIATQYAAPGGGFLTEHIPSREALGGGEAAWNRMLRDRLTHLIDLHSPEIVAVDDLPHEGIVEAVRAHPHVLWVWVRRAMWPRGAGQEWITEGKVFDHVLEPGEFAALADDGPTVADRASAHRVEPITLLDAGELLDPAAARADLGLDADRPAALVRLGDTRIVERLEGHGFQVVVRDQAVSRYLRAFDLVVSSADYDAYHEQLRFGIPTILVPSRDTVLDDQLARARYADAAGVALTVEDPESEELERALDSAARADKRAVLRRRCEELTFSNGASAAATWLGGLAARHERIGG